MHGNGMCAVAVGSREDEVWDVLGQEGIGSNLGTAEADILTAYWVSRVVPEYGWIVVVEIRLPID